MGKKTSPEIIEKMKELYATYGTFSAVAKELGVAPTTVKKYVTESTARKETKISSYDGPRPIANPKYPIFPKFLNLTPVEQISYRKILEELTGNVTSSC